MAKEEVKVNKSEEVRKYQKAHRKATPTEVSAALKEKGIDVSPQAVSTIKFNMLAKRKARKEKKAAEASSNGHGKPTVKRKMKRRGRKAKATVAPEMISLDALIAARDVVAKLGGIGAVKEAVAALEKLGG